MANQPSSNQVEVSRRDFLATAAASATLALAGCKEMGSQHGGGEQSMPADGGLDTGGISLANFDAARKRAAAIVAKMTLAEKITQFGTGTPAIPRIGLPGFNFYGSEGLQREASDYHLP